VFSAPTRPDAAAALPQIRRGRPFVLIWAAVYPLAMGLGAVLYVALRSSLQRQ
jgi:hypothetical protein